MWYECMYVCICGMFVYMYIVMYSGLNIRCACVGTY